ncbi:hypothetical protein KIL84_020445 [Mauremys mutica]|uniref:Uncharacterized protein n=1 Tax=Mauremys mutica TaxID=74926 RepID=A0A9D4BB76_9SAUR|nr:hypothetical protein KIL84_020445 [Mauremys mutica]
MHKENPSCSSPQAWKGCVKRLPADSTPPRPQPAPEGREGGSESPDLGEPSETWDLNKERNGAGCVLLEIIQEHLLKTSQRPPRFSPNPHICRLLFAFHKLLR